MFIILLTGLSGAGKSTLAAALAEKLQQKNYPVAIIDGDHYRRTLNADLGFSEADRRENILRLMQVAEEKKRAGIISIIAAINPYEDQRRELMAGAGAIVVYVKCALAVLIERDTKGLYKKGLLPDGHLDKIYNLSGINDRYDVPVHPDLVLDSSVEPVGVSTERLFTFVSELLRHPSSG
jgi:adenylylsulfate kinase